MCFHASSRLNRAIGVVFLSLLFTARSLHAQVPQGMSAGDMTSTFETVKVADGIFAFIAPLPKSMIVSGNSVAIIGDDGIVVVDTGLTPLLAQGIIREIKARSDKPVRYVITTHWHWDHNLGNATFRAAYPGAIFLSTPFTRQSMNAFNTRQLAGYQKRGDEFVARMRASVASGKNDDGTPFTPEELRRQRDLVTDLANAMPSIQSTHVDLPELTFEHDVTLHLGKREVRVVHPGKANTAGDAVVFVPDSRVLVTGDMLVYPTPYATTAYIAEWSKNLRKLLELSPGAIVPGHGPVMRDDRYARRVIELLDSIAAQVKAAVAAGMTLEQTRAHVDVSAFEREMTAFDPRWVSVFRELFSSPAIDAAWKEEKGEAIDESPFQ
jgi:glyoxylase-like metal-dependent hydrolase (beta-lactamase superfamily II)